MAALLFSELNSYIDNNVIDEIGVTLDPTLPPIFLVDTKLGIAKSVLKSVFFYAMGQMNTLRSLLYNANQSDGHYAMWSSLLNATRIVLIVKGDHPSAYDMRKRMICMWQLPVQKELSFTSLLFTRHPKCPSGWQHRRWCLSRNSYLRNETVQLLPAAVETERELCRSMAEAHPKNYYAWVHRLWLLPFLSKYQVNFLIV